MTYRPTRSWLFAPGMDARKIEKALASASDAVILDIEDAVALSAKAEARRMAREVLGSVSPERRVYVRVNSFVTGMTVDDLRAVCVGGLAGVLLPMVDGPDEVRLATSLIDTLSAEAGVPVAQIRLMALIETARGVLRAAETAQAGGRLDLLMFGAGDFTNDIGIPTSNVGPHILNAKIQVALAARSAGKRPPVDSVFFDVTDPAGFEEDARGAKALGFGGKAVIHPSQVEVANAVFSPSGAEIEEARQIADAFNEAEAKGIGAIRVNGKLVDYAMVKNAEKVLALARALDLT